MTGDEGSASILLGHEILVRLSSPQNVTLVYFDESLDQLEQRCEEMRSYLPSAKGYLTANVTENELKGHLSSVPNSKEILIGVISRSDRFLEACRQVVANDRQSDEARSSVTLLAMTYRHHPSGFQTTIHTSSLVAKEGIYPALFPRQCQIAEPFNADASREPMAGRVHEAINRVIDNLYPGALSDAEWEWGNVPEHRPLVQAFAFMSQPYIVGEPYTGMKGARVSLKQTIHEYQQILAGEFRSLDPKVFRYKNVLPEQVIR